VTSSATSAEPAAARSPGRRRRLARRLSTLLGAALALGGAAFVAERLATGWSDYGEVIARARWGWLLPGLVLAALGMSAMGLVWRRVIRALGGEVSRGQVFVWYQLGNLGKYVPGGLWSLVGRSELAVRGGLPRPIAYNSVALSMGATYLCGLIVCALLVPFVLATSGDLGSQVWVFAVIPIGLAALHPAVLGRVFRLAERFLGKGAPTVVPRWTTSVGLVARHALPWLAIGTASWFVALTFAPNAPVVPIVFAGILSWVIGFMIVFVPGGIGVREAVFTAIASVVLPPHVAATIAIVSRLVFVAADGLGAIVAAALATRRRTAT
jgi:uncharacterized membrane protein YbhN (UPF0104 family)